MKYSCFAFFDLTVQKIFQMLLKFIIKQQKDTAIRTRYAVIGTKKGLTPKPGR